MIRFLSHALVAFGSLAAVAFAANAGFGTTVQAATPGVGTTTCELRVGNSGGMTKLEGFVNAASTLSGTYRLVVAASGASGSSDIEQSGSFTATKGAPVSLGVMMLGGSGQKYTAKLSVKWASGGTSCTRQIG